MQFETIPVQVLAVKFDSTGSNPEQVLDFLKNNTNVERPYIFYGVEQNLIKFFFNKEKITIEPGMWLVINGDNLSYGSDDEFRKKYRRKINYTNTDISLLLSKVEEELKPINTSKSISLRISVVVADFLNKVGIKIV